jgi:hypothetical protein
VRSPRPLPQLKITRIEPAEGPHHAAAELKRYCRVFPRRVDISLLHLRILLGSMARQSKLVRVSDKMQRGYRYALTAPIGRDFGREFRPELTPKEMLRLGVFCGKYMTDCRKEFPASWFAQARLSPSGRDCSLNYFGVDASQPLSVWRKKGWIHPDDPRGWFQWYCRYYMGRRTPQEDARQIKRWRAIRRHAAQIKRQCERGDLTCRKRQRQVLLHWAYDSRKI